MLTRNIIKGIAPTELVFVVVSCQYLAPTELVHSCYSRLQGSKSSCKTMAVLKGSHVMTNH